jgi:hypothetical protein
MKLNMQYPRLARREKILTPYAIHMWLARHKKNPTQCAELQYPRLARRENILNQYAIHTWLACHEKNQTQYTYPTLTGAALLPDVYQRTQIYIIVDQAERKITRGPKHVRTSRDVGQKRANLS